MEKQKPEKFYENSRKTPYKMMDDSAKWILIPAKIFLDSLGLWPDRQNLITAIANVYCIGSLLGLITAQAAYIFDKDTDIASAADSLSGILAAAEATGRRFIVVVLAKRISKVLNKIYCHFWPSDIAGKTLHRELNKGTWLLVAAVLFLAAQAFSWGFQCDLTPLTYHKLDIGTKFWGDYMKSPYYEFLYIWEALACIVVGASICALDLFFPALIWQCVAQFKLLKKFLKIKFHEIVRRNAPTSPGQRSEAMNLILFTFRRHNELIETCREIEGMLTAYILVLYVGTIGTLCLASFLLTVVKSHRGRGVNYLFGHMIIIFTYCYVGNELILESSALASAVAECGWHLRPYDRDLQKSLILLMVRAQRPLTLSVGGFGVLNISSFLTLVQFSFSIYTVLGKTMGKENQNKRT